MILPTNGKVAIFDDKYPDVQKLLGSLSKSKIPYFYFQDEGGDDLPDTPIKNIRVVFLDLQLVSDNNSRDTDIVSFIGGRLHRVLEPHSNYVLVYWSTKQEKYREVIDAAFEDGLSDYKPIFKISLNKTEALKKGSAAIQFIIDEIIKNLDDFKVLKVFSFWENLVNDSSGNLINDFIEFIDKGDNWDNNAKYLLYKLAYAYSGKGIADLDEIEQIKNAFFTLNHTFIDTLESYISYSLEEKRSEFVDVVSDSGDGKIITYINKKLLVYEDNFLGDLPGTLFFIDSEIEEQKKQITSKVEQIKRNTNIPEAKKEVAISSAEKKAKEENDTLTFRLSALNKNYNSITSSLLNDETRDRFNEVRDNSIRIELNISPICDYAQNKMPCCRILPGLLVSDEYDFINEGNAYNYKSDAKIHLGGKDYWFVFDFRFLYSTSSSNSKKRSSTIKLRQQLLADIQLKLGSHINRAGVLYL